MSTHVSSRRDIGTLVGAAARRMAGSTHEEPLGRSSQAVHAASAVAYGVCARASDNFSAFFTAVAELEAHRVSPLYEWLSHEVGRRPDLAALLEAAPRSGGVGSAEG